jgi:hypothetical protein
MKQIRRRAFDPSVLMDLVFPVSSEVAGSPLPVTRHRKWVRQSSICRLSILRAYFGYVRQMQPDTDTWSERDLCSRSLSSIRERERASLKPDRDFMGLLHNPDSPSARDMLDVRNQAGVHHVESAHRTEEKGAGTHLHGEQAARGS